jgi:hypothetical protein
MRLIGLRTSLIHQGKEPFAIALAAGNFKQIAKLPEKGFRPCSSASLRIPKCLLNHEQIRGV